MSNYRRYGAGLEFLSFKEYHRQWRLMEEMNRMMKQGATLTNSAAKEMERMVNRLLIHIPLMEDILPESPPGPIPKHLPIR